MAAIYNMFGGPPDPIPYAAKSWEGYTYTQNNYLGLPAFAHPFKYQTFTELTMSAVFRCNVPPITAEAGGLFYILGGSPATGMAVARRPISTQLYFFSTIASQTDVTTVIPIASTIHEISIDHPGWAYNHWYWMGMSYSYPLGQVHSAIRNLTLGEETVEVARTTLLNVEPIEWKSQEYSSATAACAWQCSSGEVEQTRFRGDLAQELIHNKFIDLSDLSNRNKLSCIDGVKDLGGFGARVFGEVPLVYMEGGYAQDNKGTTFIGELIDLFEYTEYARDANVPPTGTCLIEDAPLFINPILDLEWDTLGVHTLEVERYFNAPTQPNTFTIASGSLPPGTKLGYYTGIITGTPTSATTGSLSIRCTNAFGTDVTNVFNWTTVVDTSYSPGMMRFTDSGQFEDAIVTAGNACTIVGGFRCRPFTGNTYRYVACLFGPNGFRVALTIFSSDYATAELRNKVHVSYYSTTAWTSLCVMLSKEIVADDKEHTLFSSFDATTGVPIFYIDSLDADDLTYTSRKALTGTLNAGSSWFIIGAQRYYSVLYGLIGHIGYIGYKDGVALTNPLDFMDGNKPKQLDEATWSEWSGQPDYWRADGNMVLNQGTQGAMYERGSINGPHKSYSLSNSGEV